MKWFCVLCWRSGEIFSEDIRDAQHAHNGEVQRDMKAEKIPAGMDDRFRGSPMMLRLPAEYCAGDVKLGDLPQRKPRFDKSSMPTFPEFQ